MAVQVTAITGRIVLPSGGYATGGRITARLSTIGKVEDAGVTQKLYGDSSFAIGADGSVSFTLVPNSVITPAATHYRMDYETKDGFKWVEYVTVPATTPLDIGDLVQVSP